MFQIRIHGRGGQGVVTAAEMLSIAAFFEGRFAQAFPSFGSERTGAPVVSYCRIDDKPIRVREPIVAPDAVIVQDPTVLHLTGVVDDLAPGAHLIVNTSRELDLALADVTIDALAASEIARAHFGRPLPNAVLLGAFAAVTSQLQFDAVEHAIRAKFSGATGDGNVAAARAAYDLMKEAGRVAAG